MAKDQTKRLNPKILTANDNTFAALQKVAGYTPSDQNYKLANGTVLASAMKDRGCNSKLRGKKDSFIYR